MHTVKTIITLAFGIVAISQSGCSGKSGESTDSELSPESASPPIQSSESVQTAPVGIQESPVVANVTSNSGESTSASSNVASVDEMAPMVSTQGTQPLEMDAVSSSKQVKVHGPGIKAEMVQSDIKDADKLAVVNERTTNSQGVLSSDDSTTSSVADLE